MSGAAEPPHKIPKVEGVVPSFVPVSSARGSPPKAVGSEALGSSSSPSAGELKFGDYRVGSGGGVGSSAGTATSAPGGAGVSSSSAVESVRPRKKGVSVSCPIAYGSIAFWLGKKKQDEFTTHKWTQITSTPFEVTEMGWGEFEAKITLHFKDPSEKPVDVIHQLRLYADSSTPLNTKKPVLSEQYDEVVFTDPHDDFYGQLMLGQTAPRLKKQEHQEHLSTFADGDTLQRLAAAREWVHTKLGETKDKIRKADMELTKLKNAAAAAATSQQRAPVRHPSMQGRR